VNVETLPNEVQGALSQSGGDAPLTPNDLAEIIRAFNEVTARLQRTHEALQGEVSRLKGELHEANAQLRRARELAALGEMAAGIAHEIRNPLGSIRLYATVLEEDLSAMPGAQETARKIGRAVRGLDAIVSDVLAFARDVRISAAPAETAGVVDRAVDACRESIQSAEADVEVRIGEDAAELACDAGLVHQALVNVIRNAAEAVQEGCEGSGARRIIVEVSLSESGDARGRRRSMVCFTVRDTGPGVGEEMVQRMFNPFFTTRASGTGLGLAIVHRIVDAHGGRVSVRNDSRGGAAVDLLLPREGPEDRQGDT